MSENALSLAVEPTGRNGPGSGPGLPAGRPPAAGFSSPPLPQAEVGAHRLLRFFYPRILRRNSAVAHSSRPAAAKLPGQVGTSDGRPVPHDLMPRPSAGPAQGPNLPAWTAASPLPTHNPRPRFGDAAVFSRAPASGHSDVRRPGLPASPGGRLVLSAASRSKRRSIAEPTARQPSIKQKHVLRTAIGKEQGVPHAAPRRPGPGGACGRQCAAPPGTLARACALRTARQAPCRAAAIAEPPRQPGGRGRADHGTGGLVVVHCPCAARRGSGRRPAREPFGKIRHVG